MPAVLEHLCSFGWWAWSLNSSLWVCMGHEGSPYEQLLIADICGWSTTSHGRSLVGSGMSCYLCSVLLTEFILPVTDVYFLPLHTVVHPAGSHSLCLEYCSVLLVSHMTPSMYFNLFSPMHLGIAVSLQLRVFKVCVAPFSFTEFLFCLFFSQIWLILLR